MGGVIDVEIRTGGRPTDRDRVLKGEIREAVGRDFAGGTGDWGAGLESGVEMGARSADEDEEGDKLRDEGPSNGRDGVSCSWVPNMGSGWMVPAYLSYT